MEEKNIQGVGPVKARYQNDSITFFVGRQQVIWRDGRWTDDNRGRAYLHYTARELIVKEFGLKAA